MTYNVVPQTGNLELDEKIHEWLAWDKTVDFIRLIKVRNGINSKWNAAAAGICRIEGDLEDVAMNEQTISEIKELVKKNDVKVLEELLLSRLTFGTAGLRGIMSAGYSRMNDLVIIQTSQGMAKYLEKVCPNVKKQGVVIGYDGRHNSLRFSELVACIMMSLGIPVYLFAKMVPTPFVPYTINKYGAAAGVMVTASHNPKEDNGYKVYWTNGAQIISPHDKGIQKSIEENLEPWPESWNYTNVRSNTLYKEPLDEVMTTYFKMINDNVIYREINAKTPLKFTFTPMHGVGYVYMVEAFKAAGFAPFIPVLEQIQPDPEFPTVKFPNPEEGKSALDLSIRTANENGSTIILANDPDSDRLAVAEKQPNGEWKVFTGNEIGSMLGWWLWHCFKTQNPDVNGKDVYMLASTVSSKILAAIGKKEGFNFVETLTGFKWMGNRSCELMAEGKTVLFAFEEAIGFMCGTTVLDKDGISAAMKMAELAAYLQDTQGMTLTEKLRNIFEVYGLHISRNSYYICHHQPTIKSMFERLRNFSGKPDTYPETCGQFPVKYVRDLTTGYDNSQPDNRAILPSSASSQMITFTFENGCVATLRTSGTEPKIKYYTEYCAHPEQSDSEAVVAELEKLVANMVEEYMEPGKNKLIPRSD